MGKVALIARIILGLIFFVFGLNGFFQFIQPAPHGEEAMAFMGALFATSYFFPVLKIFEIVSGALLLSGRFVPLALLFLAPIVLQIFLFHAFLSPDAGFTLAILVLILELYLGIVVYRSSFCAILSAGGGSDGDDSTT